MTADRLGLYHDGSSRPRSFVPHNSKIIGRLSYVTAGGCPPRSRSTTAVVGRLLRDGQRVARAKVTASRRAARVTSRTGPSGSLLSRTATASATAPAASANSTQSPPFSPLRVLLRHTSPATSTQLPPLEPV